MLVQIPADAQKQIGGPRLIKFVRYENQLFLINSANDRGQDYCRLPLQQVETK